MVVFAVKGEIGFDPQRAGVESKRKGEGCTKRDANLQLRTVARTRAPSTRTQRKIGGGSGKKP